METFADYILEEEELIKKMEIMHYLKKRTGIFYDNSVVFKAELARLFIDIMRIPVDRNMVLTACLLYACKKTNMSQDVEKIKGYGKEGAKYLKELGFSDKFCKICEQHNRYTATEAREKESDILELVDQFGGMLMDRPDRMRFKALEAIVLLENRNLKDKNNRYLELFKQFVEKTKGVRV